MRRSPSRSALGRRAVKSDVEPELDDVAVLHDVFFALDAEFAGIAGFALGAEGNEVVEGDGFGGDEAALASNLSPKISEI